MLVMKDEGEGKLLSSKFTLGAEGSVAASPVGRTATAQTDVQLHAEILSWSRSQGLFAGIVREFLRSAQAAERGPKRVTDWPPLRRVRRAQVP